MDDKTETIQARTNEPENTEISPPLTTERPRRVLIVKPSALGDVVTAMPVLHALRRSFGSEITIDWLVDKSCLAAIAEEPLLDEAIVFDRSRYGKMLYSPSAARDFLAFCRMLAGKKYDWVIDLQGLFRSGFLSRVTAAKVRAGFASARELAWIFYTHKLPADQTPLHTVDRNIALAKMLGLDAQEEDFRLTVPASARDWLDKFTADLPDGFILAVPATRWTTKLYPTQHWHAALEELAKHRPVILVASPNEKHLTAPLADIPNTIDLAGKTSIAQLIALISAADCVISCDSAAMHMAAALAVPQITLIGPTKVQKTGPYKRDNSVLVTPLDCGGCLKKKCSKGDCMHAIEPDRLIEAVIEKLQ